MQVNNKAKLFFRHVGFNIMHSRGKGYRRPGLLAFLPLILVLGACASEAPGSMALVNFKGYACDLDGLVKFDQLYFDADGKVLCRGSDCERQPAPGGTIDAGGATLWPGLIDAHAHLRGLGSARHQLPLNELRSLDEAQRSLAAWAEQRPDDQWIMGRGWNQMQWPVQKFPTAADIDAVINDRPVVLERVDGHALWVNSKALALANISADTVAPAGGEILLGDDGQPSGILVDNAAQLITGLIPEPDQERVGQEFLVAIREANANGLTGVHEAGISFAELQALHDLAQSGDLSLRVNVMLSDNDANLRMQGPPERGLYNGRLNVASVKIYADGALGSRGAALLAPYADRPQSKGLLFLDQEALTARIRQANQKGFQAAVHAIGDRANQVALNAFAEVQGNKPSLLRNRIEHAQVLADEDIERFAQLGVIASMQPTHATSDMWMAERRLDPPRLAGAYAWQRLRAAGAHLALGSDFPVEPVSPFFGLHAAVTRMDRNGEPPGGWHAQEALALATALCGFTRDAAFAAGEEESVGSLRPGQWADFILLDMDPFAMQADLLWRIQPRETWLGGERVYPRVPE